MNGNLYEVTFCIEAWGSQGSGALNKIALQVGTQFLCSENDWSEWGVVSAATCTAAGREERTCAFCNETQSRNVGTAPGHIWGESVITAATCTEASSSIQTCATCSETRTTPGYTATPAGCDEHICLDCIPPRECKLISCPVCHPEIQVDSPGIPGVIVRTTIEEDSPVITNKGPDTVKSLNDLLLTVQAITIPGTTDNVAADANSFLKTLLEYFRSIK
jgi:hypothetical protein